MIYKWNEITYNTFKGIFNEFLQRADYLKDKVIEIQIPAACITGKSQARVYLTVHPEILDLAGPKFERVDDCFVRPMVAVAKMEGTTPREILSRPGCMCTVTFEEESDRPLLAPLFIPGEHTMAFLSLFFGDLDEVTPIMKEVGNGPKRNDGRGYWYIKKGNCRTIDLTKGSLERWHGSQEKTVRMRTIDWDTWYKMADARISGQGLLNDEGDLDIMDFTLGEDE